MRCDFVNRHRYFTYLLEILVGKFVWLVDFLNSIKGSFVLERVWKIGMENRTFMVVFFSSVSEPFRNKVIIEVSSFQKNLAWGI